MSFAVKPVAADHLDQLARRLRTLEAEQDVADLLRLT
jgi:hypothetical protein